MEHREINLVEEIERIVKLNEILKLKVANIQEVLNVPVSDADKLKYIKLQIEESHDAEIYFNLLRL